MTLDDFYPPVTEQKGLKNEEAWNTLFSKEDILEKIKTEGIYDIDASKMKEITKREPRLMAKVESKYTLPSIMYSNKLCIMPHKTRGHYIIGHFDAFTDVSYEDSLETPVYIDKKYDLLNPYQIEKEPSLILAAFNYNVLSEIAHDEELHLTDFGRENTGTFDYYIDNLGGNEPYQINVDRSQLEMDGVFESDNYILNIEAKMGQREDFLTRQLYYPYRMIHNKSDKEVINLFMSYSAGSMYIHTYKVEKTDYYNSFKLTGNYKYNFFEDVSVRDASRIIHGTVILDEPEGIPFPQADTMNKVFDALEIIKKYPGISDTDLAYNMCVAGRQGGYYGNSCSYLGLTTRVRKRSFENYLSPLGEKFMTLPIQGQIKMMIELLSKHAVFNYFLKEYLEQSEPPEKEEIAQWIRNNISSIDPDKNTPVRRAQTVKKWMEWVLDSCNADT